MKLKTTEIKAFRESLWSKQLECCALCGEHIEITEAVLDHDHRSGLIRGVLHRGCNSLLGKIENAMPRSRVDLGRLSQISDNLIRYLTADPITDLLHPTYKIKETTMGRGRGRGRKPPKR
jgi:hypothetical protein